MDGPETLAAHTPSDVELGKQCCHGWGIGEASRVLSGGDLLLRQHSDTHTTQARDFPLVHLVRNRPRRPGAASSRPGCS